ncbi:hypothetical protein PLESTB_000345700 [Pleodorina starrii]|uniref:RING-CH-type domain-containing protein n=1 Tax=Pleodorina starrii TaxID=330485 RepID=A0A9W6BDP5_9CHLO|nr:hypothetical protein PLESTB_000345700 [Pleodorina starrii]
MKLRKCAKNPPLDLDDPLATDRDESDYEASDYDYLSDIVEEEEDDNCGLEGGSGRKDVDDNVDEGEHASGTLDRDELEASGSHLLNNAESGVDARVESHQCASAAEDYEEEGDDADDDADDPPCTLRAGFNPFDLLSGDCESSCSDGEAATAAVSSTPDGSAGPHSDNGAAAGATYGSLVGERRRRRLRKNPRRRRRGAGSNPATVSAYGCMAAGADGTGADAWEGCTAAWADGAEADAWDGCTVARADGAGPSAAYGCMAAGADGTGADAWEGCTAAWADGAEADAWEGCTAAWADGAEPEAPSLASGLGCSHEGGNDCGAGQVAGSEGDDDEEDGAAECWLCYGKGRVAACAARGVVGCDGFCGDGCGGGGSISAAADDEYNDAESVLVAPCRTCAGSLRYIHVSCFERWMSSWPLTCPNCRQLYDSAVHDTFPGGAVSVAAMMIEAVVPSYDLFDRFPENMFARFVVGGQVFVQISCGGSKPSDVLCFIRGYVDDMMSRAVGGTLVLDLDGETVVMRNFDVSGLSLGLGPTDAGDGETDGQQGQEPGAPEGAPYDDEEASEEEWEEEWEVEEEWEGASLLASRALLSADSASDSESGSVRLAMAASLSEAQGLRGGNETSGDGGLYTGGGNVVSRYVRPVVRPGTEVVLDAWPWRLYGHARGEQGRYMPWHSSVLRMSANVDMGPPADPQADPWSRSGPVSVYDSDDDEEQRWPDGSERRSSAMRSAAERAMVRAEQRRRRVDLLHQQRTQQRHAAGIRGQQGMAGVPRRGGGGGRRR